MNAKVLLLDVLQVFVEELIRLPLIENGRPHGPIKYFLNDVDLVMGCKVVLVYLPVMQLGVQRVLVVQMLCCELAPIPNEVYHQVECEGMPINENAAFAQRHIVATGER